MSRPLSKPLRLLLLGAPGSGKGTQTGRLLKRFPSIQAVSSGDLLRQQIRDKTELGSIASNYIKEGKLLPDALITDLLINDLSAKNWLTPAGTWLLDGFPRTRTQAESLTTALNAHNANLNLVVELDVPSEVILERIENRWIHAPSGRVYNLSYNPPKVAGLDDVTGEPLTKRADDNVETFKKRLDEYHATVGPLKEYYAELGICHTVTGETSDIIFPQLMKLLENKFC